MSKQIAFAIIGGSGLCEMKGLTETQEHTIDTPFGKPSWAKSYSSKKNIRRSYESI